MYGPHHKHVWSCSAAIPLQSTYSKATATHPLLSLSLAGFSYWAVHCIVPGAHSAGLQCAAWLQDGGCYCCRCCCWSLLLLAVSRRCPPMQALARHRPASRRPQVRFAVQRAVPDSSSIPFRVQCSQGKHSNALDVCIWTSWASLLRTMCCRCAAETCTVPNQLASTLLMVELQQILTTKALHCMFTAAVQQCRNGIREF